MFLLVLAVLAAGGYRLENHYGLSAYVKDLYRNFRNTFTEQGPVRGTFYDRNLKQLAVTLERVSVYARTREIDSIQETATQLSRVLKIDQDKMVEQLESGVLRFWVAKDIDQQQEEAVKNLHLPGVYLQRDQKRYYPNDSQAAHFVGYVENGIGLAGVEFYYDRLLAGRKIKQQEKKELLRDSPDLVLSLDLKIEDILDGIVKEIADAGGVEKVAAYLIEENTGEIVGGSILPGFNPNFFAKYPQERTENMFFVPLCMPEKFRLFLRDATMLLAGSEDLAGQEKAVSPSAWSLIRDPEDLGGRLRWWERLGLQGPLETDFYVPTHSAKKAIAAHQKPVTASAIPFDFVPESAAPLNILTSFSMLLNKGKKIHPSVVKKILDRETGQTVLLGSKEDGSEQVDGWSKDADDRIQALFHSQASEGPVNTYFFRDNITVSINSDAGNRLLVDELLFVTIPAGSNGMNMLLVVERTPPGVEGKKGSDKSSLEQIVADKVERISVLQQVDKSLADVVEPEAAGGDNYQGGDGLIAELSGGAKNSGQKQTSPGIMPDLRGMSLRKSLRLMQGVPLSLKIQGTGKVIDQRPPPGSSLQGVTECLLILEKQEDISIEKLSKKLPGKD